MEERELLESFSHHQKVEQQIHGWEATPIGTTSHTHEVQERLQHQPPLPSSSHQPVEAHHHLTMGAQLNKESGHLSQQPTVSPSLAPIELMYPTTGPPIELRETPGWEEYKKELSTESDTIFISIILACYKQAQYLEETVQSVVAQSYPRWELIIVDDGSPDNSWDIAVTLIETYQNLAIKAVRKKNGGLADARNIGSQFARGNWICMLDSDDLLGKMVVHKM